MVPSLGIGWWPNHSLKQLNESVRSLDPDISIFKAMAAKVENHCFRSTDVMEHKPIVFAYVPFSSWYK